MMLGIKHPPMVVHCRPANFTMQKTAPNQSEHLAHAKVRQAPPLKAEIEAPKAKLEKIKTESSSNNFPFVICDSKPLTQQQLRESSLSVKS